MEATLEAPALLEWSSLRQPGVRGQGTGAEVGGLLAGWVASGVPSGDSGEAGWSPQPCLFPSLPFLCYLFSHQSRSWCVK